MDTQLTNSLHLSWIPTPCRPILHPSIACIRYEPSLPRTYSHQHRTARCTGPCVRVCVTTADVDLIRTKWLSRRTDIGRWRINTCPCVPLHRPLPYVLYLPPTPFRISSINIPHPRPSHLVILGQTPHTVSGPRRSRSTHLCMLRTRDDVTATPQSNPTN